jgi:phosphoribosylanthranilate isomerase
MRTFVRFGGLTNAASAALVPEGGAGGFVVGVPASPRNLDDAAIGDLIDALPNNAEAWAQVQDPSAAQLRRLFDEIGVDRIEVHGRVPDGLEFLEIHHLVPALPIPLPGVEGPRPTVPPPEDAPMLVLETAGLGLVDGHSTRSNWEMCQQLVDEQPGRKLIVSGGIELENLAEMLPLVRPWGVGVAAVLERRPGEYDPEKVRSFLEAVVAAETS